MKEKTMAKNTTPNFSAEMEARIGETAPHNLASATELATEFGKSPRSVVAKIVRMGVGYTSKTPMSKSGDPVISKSDLVAQISALVEGNLDGLDKAPKAALKALVNFAQANG